jgi:hypothetical protein
VGLTTGPALTFSDDIIIEGRIIVFFGGVDPVDDGHRGRSGGIRLVGGLGMARAVVAARGGPANRRPTAVPSVFIAVPRAVPVVHRLSTGPVDITVRR